LVVYISEAHAQDEWPLGKQVCLNQHKTIEERLKAANDFNEQFHCRLPVLVDTMDNNFDNAYACWPERFFIIEHDKMAMIGHPSNEFGYERDLIVKWLRSRKPTIAEAV